MYWHGIHTYIYTHTYAHTLICIHVYIYIVEGGGVEQVEHLQGQRRKFRKATFEWGWRAVGLCSPSLRWWGRLCRRRCAAGGCARAILVWGGVSRGYTIIITSETAREFRRGSLRSHWQGIVDIYIYI